MMKHRDIQATHEESVLNSFKNFLSTQDLELDVVDKPDPPDAIVQLAGMVTWIEITDAFHDANWARSITSYAADDKEHKPYKKAGVITEPDRLAQNQVESVILKKYRKATMLGLLASHGKGILLVGMYLPLTRPEEIVELFGDELLAKIRLEKQIFNKIYLYENQKDGHRFVKLL